MVTRWEVEDAVLASQVEPTGRQIMLTLLTRSEAATAQIPPKYAPSFTDLQSLTGLSRSALTEWMKALTDGGWIRREQFPGESKPGFVLAIGVPNAARPKRPRDEKRQSSVPPSGTAVAQAEGAATEADVDGAYRLAIQTAEPAMPRGGTKRAARRYSTEDATLFKNSPTESSTSTLTEAAPPPATETEGQRVNRLARVYTDVVPISNFHAVASCVRKAVKTGVTDERITAGLKKLAADGRAVTLDSLRYAIYGKPKPEAFKPMNEPYRNPQNQDEYDDWKKAPA